MTPIFFVMNERDCIGCSQSLARGRRRGLYFTSPISDMFPDMTTIGISSGRYGYEPALVSATSVTTCSSSVYRVGGFSSAGALTWTLIPSSLSLHSACYRVNYKDRTRTSRAAGGHDTMTSHEVESISINVGWEKDFTVVTRTSSRLLVW